MRKAGGHGSAPAHRPVGAAGYPPNPYGGPNPAAPTPPLACAPAAAPSQPVWQSPRPPSLGSAARPRSRRTNRRTGSSSSRPPSRRRPASEPDQRVVTVCGGDGRWHRSRTQTVTPSVMLIARKRARFVVGMVGKDWLVGSRATPYFKQVEAKEMITCHREDGRCEGSVLWPATS
jgi:hypothetical protein